MQFCGIPLHTTAVCQIQGSQVLFTDLDLRLMVLPSHFQSPVTPETPASPDSRYSRLQTPYARNTRLQSMYVHIQKEHVYIEYDHTDHQNKREFNYEVWLLRYEQH